MLASYSHKLFKQQYVPCIRPKQGHDDATHEWYKAQSGAKEDVGHHFALEPLGYADPFGSANYESVGKTELDEGADDGEKEGEDEAPSKVESENVEGFVEEMVALADEE
jgi:hypothetical protein